MNSSPSLAQRSKSSRSDANDALVEGGRKIPSMFDLSASDLPSPLPGGSSSALPGAAFASCRPPDAPPGLPQAGTPVSFGLPAAAGSVDQTVLMSMFAQLNAKLDDLASNVAT